MSGSDAVDGAVQIIVHAARCLPDVQLWGDQDPYVIAQLKADGSDSAVGTDADDAFACTEWVPGGGTACEWGEEHGNVLRLTVPPGKDGAVADLHNVAIAVEVWNANALIDDHVAGTVLDLAEVTAGSGRLCSCDRGGCSR